MFQSIHPMERFGRQRKVLGVQTFHYLDNRRNVPVIAECWYPAVPKGAAEKISLESLWEHPTEFRNAPLYRSQDPYPLILISHGYRGGRRDLSWLAELLVKQGYIVAAAEHIGSARESFDLEASLRFWDRPQDVTCMLNGLIQEPFFQKALDLNKIGFIGYSLGGMTGLALGGATAENVRSIAPKVYQELQVAAPTQENLDHFDFSEAERSYTEPRIRSFLLLCPATYVYSSKALSQIRAPIGLIAAIGDDVLPFQEHAFRLIRYVMPKKLKIVRKEISHYAFLNRLSAFGKKMLHEGFLKEHPCCVRSSVHREVGAFAIDFFADTLQSAQ